MAVLGCLPSTVSSNWNKNTSNCPKRHNNKKNTMEASAEIMDHGDGISLLSPASKTPSLGVGRWCTVLAHFFNTQNYADLAVMYEFGKSHSFETFVLMVNLDEQILLFKDGSESYGGWSIWIIL